MRITESEQRILTAIMLAGRTGMTTAQLIDCLYGDRVDGGPLTAQRVIYVMICRLNKVLGDQNPPARILTATRGCRGARYVLATVQPVPVH